MIAEEVISEERFVKDGSPGGEDYLYKNKEIWLQIAILTRRTCLWQSYDSLMPGQDKVCIFWIIGVAKGGAKRLSYGQLVRSWCGVFEEILAHLIKIGYFFKA